MRGIQLVTIAAAVLALAGSATALEPGLPPAAGLALDIAQAAPGFADAAASYARGQAQPYQDLAVAGLGAAARPAQDAWAQASTALCPACHVGRALLLLPPAERAALDASAAGDEPARLVAAQAAAIPRALARGQAPDAPPACLAAQDAWLGLGQAGRDARGLGDAAAGFGSGEARALPVPADGLPALPGTGPLPASGPGDFPLTC